MEASSIRNKFLEFFKARGHAVVPSSSLVPDDPSVLLTTAGMQQFKRYYTGELDAVKDFGSKNTASVQKSFRTSDIDEVGDETHLTFFEMLGNFSFGGYWKKEAIGLAYEFITKEMGLAISYVTVFKGSDAVPKDEESKSIWKALGVSDIREEGMDDVFWGPTGTSGPCGPTTEIYCKNAAGKDVEIWNVVFNEFFCTGSREALLAGNATLKPLATKGIDTGMGLERLAMVAQKKNNIFETDLFENLKTEQLSNGERRFLLPGVLPERTKRIILDHVRGVGFLITDGVMPSNKGAGYILRRLMRRMIVHEYLINEDVVQRKIDISYFNFEPLFRALVVHYKDFYKELKIETIKRVYDEENSKFLTTVRGGLKELGHLKIIDAKSAFKLYETFGLPYEIIKEFGKERAQNLTREDFDEEFKKHQELSRAGAEKKFGGHGLIFDTGELKAGSEEEMKKVLRLHTATHLLQRALREVLGPEVHQMGSDITPERTRFDFSFPRKMTPEEIKKTEELVNEKIKEDLPMQYKEMSKGGSGKDRRTAFLQGKISRHGEGVFCRPRPRVRVEQGILRRTARDAHGGDRPFPDRKRRSGRLGHPSPPRHCRRAIGKQKRMGGRERTGCSLAEFVFVRG